MRGLDEIAADLKTVLEEHFQTVRITTVQTGEQFLREIRAISPEKLPGVIIVCEQSLFTNENTIRESAVSLVLIDRFVAGSDEKALSVFRASEKLLELFPPDGRTINEVFYLPTDCAAASTDKDYACLALALTAKQDI